MQFVGPADIEGFHHQAVAAPTTLLKEMIYLCHYGQLAQGAR
jgi:hypothetical protein